MKNVALFVVVLALLPLAVQAEEPQRKSCDELKNEIVVKFDAKGVQNYTLTAVKNDEVKAADKVVGSCDGGAMKIVYTRN